MKTTAYRLASSESTAKTHVVEVMADGLSPAIWAGSFHPTSLTPACCSFPVRWSEGEVLARPHEAKKRMMELSRSSRCGNCMRTLNRRIRFSNEEA
jgi:hypothetical protein